MADDQRFGHRPKISVLGLGLIGGSLLLRLRELGYEVSAYDIDARTREAAGAAGSVAEAVDGAAIAVVAVPLPAMEEVLARLGHFDGVLTDVTSVKRRPAELVAKVLPEVRYVGGHPMSGTERSGFAAADPGLFTGRAWVLCLDEGTKIDDWLALADVYTGLGARVVPATAAEHDEVVAAISHLPHLVANGIAVGADAPLALGLAAGSFRDGTRVAATRAELTAAMCGGNSEALAARLDALIAELSEARRLLDAPDPIAALTPWLARGQRVRADWPPAAGDERTEAATAEGLLALGREGGWVTAVLSTVADNGQSVSTVRPVGR
ncbi:prephenate dehydrogenase [Fodinicola acaciae]|uniref:prephenate dehydrogenase n=1 Tax=Fodinicola acaciae TaxID=2681555 RepID=UPI0013D050F0|nr:prephenate dehydrogenase/arogenate dehydrogenase family protein [Fodinicola acaciae]